MKYTKMVRFIVVSAALLGGFLYTQPAQAAASGLEAVVQNNDPAKPTIKLTNKTNAACQIINSPLGTVAITKLVQDGKNVEPSAMNVGFDDGVEVELARHWQTLKPGESADIALRADNYRNIGRGLETITWSPGASALGMFYKLQDKKPLQLELTYTVPLIPESGAPSCGIAYASTVQPTTNMFVLIAQIIAVIVGVAAVIFAVWYFWKHRKKPTSKGAVAAIVLLGLVGVLWQNAPAAKADFVVPPDMQGAFDTCMGTLEANRDITGPVLDVANNPAITIEIVPTTGGSETAQYGENTYRIYWNPNDTHPYAGTGGNADPCTSLYHEMYHVLDLQNGTFSRDDCAGSGIETKEVMATRAQNILRARLGMPERSHYGRDALPSGDCNAPPATACTGEHCADSNGDPHLKTFDGLRYDFQAVGEFVGARTDNGDFELQVRQQPFPGLKDVSVNTAIAMKVGDDKVEIRARDYNTMQLLVNGKDQELKAMALPGGGNIDLTGNVAAVTWPNKSTATFYPIGNYGIHLAVDASDELVGKLQGLLGDANGDTKNDLHARGSDKTIQPTFKELYPAFADSWRIEDKTSLFTYDSGKNTASYTDRSFPAAEVKAADLPNYKAAKTICESFGITDETVLDNCALDVGLTGRAEFAKAASTTQQLSAAKNFGGTTWQVSIKNKGDVGSVTFDGKQGEKVFVSISKTALPSQCGTILLLAPGGKQIADGCIINRIGYIDGTVLPATGTYTIQIKPYGDETGSAQVQLVRIADKQVAITDEASATIDKPGVVARFTFSAQAGERVFVDVPSSSLPSQCGLLQIINPDGKTVSDGCVINGKGNIDTTSLDATGQYTILVDPSGEATGNVKIKLIKAVATTTATSINGSEQTVNLSKPGSTATFTFTATAGQRIYVDIPASSLPSQCGIIDLRAPNNNLVASGCVINGKGNISDDGTVLPVTGTYSITINPSDNATGTATIKIHT